MKLLKIKLKTKQGEISKVDTPYSTGYAIKVSAVLYGSTNPSSYLTLYDKDGDQFMFRIPGQAFVNPTTPEIPVTVQLPLYYLDDTSENDLIIWGELEKLDNKVELN